MRIVNKRNRHGTHSPVQETKVHKGDQCPVQEIEMHKRDQCPVQENKSTNVIERNKLPLSVFSCYEWPSQGCLVAFSCFEWPLRGCPLQLGSPLPSTCPCVALLLTQFPLRYSQFSSNWVLT